ncbi:MAG: rhomboid family intramembrane serine protease [Clostridiales bacterium]|nr:rhomboid family intramembrane serine protease [Clostridiales bacterium]
MKNNHQKITAKTKNRLSRNAVAIILVLVFVFVYIFSHRAEDVASSFGATGLNYLNGEYYRWFTCLFLHYNPGHLLANSAALLSVGSLLGSFLKKKQSLFLFLSCGILAEIAYSLVVSDQIYDIGASSGVFALIACLIVCCLRFQGQFHFIWYRPDVVIVFVYFIFANTSVTAFLVHTFGFAFGILISSVMIWTGRIHMR